MRSKGVEQGWCSAWCISRRRRHLWVEFVVGSLLCSETFFCRYSSFPLSSKTNISKFQFDQESGRRRTTMCSANRLLHLIATSKSFLFILFIHLNQILILKDRPQPRVLLGSESNDDGYGNKTAINR